MALFLRQPRAGRRIIDVELQRLQDSMLAMGSRASRAILHSVEILRSRDFDAAKQMILDDQEINDQQYKIEAGCLQLIATQTPKASDLRAVASIMEIANELERIHDYAKGVAKITLRIGHEPLLESGRDLHQMAAKAQGMLRRSLLAFTQRDAPLATAVSTLDDEIDDLYNQIYKNVINEILQNPQVADHANLILWVAHNLERTGDRALNICERAIFTATGTLIELD